MNYDIDSESSQLSELHWEGDKDCRNLHTMDNEADTGVKNIPAKGSNMLRVSLNDNKAGMAGLDKEKINQIIFEASKGSKYFENEKRKEEIMSKRLEGQRQRLLKLTPEQITQGEKRADELAAVLEQSRDLSRTIVHVDMDAFYAAVEMRDNPALRDVPMAVGGNAMLSTSNYLARRYGVRAAMPGFIARKLCPDLVIVKTHFDKYTEVSRQVRQVFDLYDPCYAPMSLDEAHLDLTEHLVRRRTMPEEDRTVVRTDLPHCACADKDAGADVCSSPPLYDSDVTCAGCGLRTQPERVVFGLEPEDAVNELRMRIQVRTQLTASAGIASTLMLAKVSSDKNKPNGQYRVMPTREDVMSFLSELPIRKVPGIGGVSEKMLRALEVHTVPDLWTRRGTLQQLYSEQTFTYFMRICCGIGENRVVREGERKSVSTERTFGEISDPDELHRKCEELCVALAEDLSRENLYGRTVTLKLKTVDFAVLTRAQSVSLPVHTLQQLLTPAAELLNTEISACAPAPLRLRLMGVRLSNFVTESEASTSKQQRTLVDMFQKSKKHSPRKKQTACDEEETTICDPERQTLKAEGETAACDQEHERADDLEQGQEGDHVTYDFVCPVCAVAVDTEDLAVFNEHIDNCLSQPAAGPAAAAGEAAQNSPARESRTDITCEPAEETPGSHVRDEPAADSMVSAAARAGEGSDVTAPPPATCPVCGGLFESRSEHGLAAHVELCLSRQAVRDLLREDEASRRQDMCAVTSSRQQAGEDGRRHRHGKRPLEPDTKGKQKAKRAKPESSIKKYFYK